MRRIALILATLGIVSGISTAQAETVATLSKKVTKLTKSVAALGARALVAGPQGPQGPIGPQGSPGPTGPSAFNSIPSGTTVYGVLGHFLTYTDFFVAHASLPAPAPVPLQSASIVVKATVPLIAACGGNQSCLSANEQTNQGFCPGTSTFPDAAPGFLCIYPTEIALTPGVAIVTGSIDGLAIETDNGSGSRFGFAVKFGMTTSDYFGMNAVWAYKAP